MQLFSPQIRPNYFQAIVVCGDCRSDDISDDTLIFVDSGLKMRGLGVPSLITKQLLTETAPFPKNQGRVTLELATMLLQNPG